MTTANRSFTVKNIGYGALTGLSVSKNGTNAADFSTDTSSLGMTIAPKSSATFTVNFTPSALGNRIAAIHIASNDVDENPFDISLTGNGLTAAEAWRLQYFGSSNNSGNGADTNDYDHDGLPNLLEWATNNHPLEASPMPGVLVRNGAVLEFTYPRLKAAVNEGIIFRPEWRDSLTNGAWSNAGVSEMILSDNGTVQMVKASVGAGSGKQRFMHLKVTRP